MNIKPNSEGIFYPKTSKALLNLFNKYSLISDSKESKLIIIPHAGYEFSGNLAFKTYQYFKKDLREILIIAPAIYNKLYGIITSNAENFTTPLGPVKIRPYKCEINNKICRTEPSISVQMPLIKYLFPETEVIPVIYGCEDYNNITKIIREKYFQGAGDTSL